jgi:hypothetical protein
MIHGTNLIVVVKVVNLNIIASIVVPIWLEWTKKILMKDLKHFGTNILKVGIQIRNASF